MTVETVVEPEVVEPEVVETEVAEIETAPVVENEAEVIEAAPVEPAKLEEEVEEFDLELSEGSLLNEADLDAFVTEVENSDWTADQAKAVLKYRESNFKLAHDRVTAVERDTAESARNEMMALPEYQPDQIEATFGKLREVNEKFGSDAFLDLMKGPLGNHKAISDLLLNVYKAIEGQKNDTGGTTNNEHDIIQGASAGTPKEADNTLKSMYPGFFTAEKN